jgi:hypothetical protein
MVALEASKQWRTGLDMEFLARVEGKGSVVICLTTSLLIDMLSNIYRGNT